MRLPGEIAMAAEASTRSSPSLSDDLFQEQLPPGPVGSPGKSCQRCCQGVDDVALTCPRANWLMTPTGPGQCTAASGDLSVSGAHGLGVPRVAGPSGCEPRVRTAW